MNTSTFPNGQSRLRRTGSGFSVFLFTPEIDVIRVPSGQCHLIPEFPTIHAAIRRLPLQ